MTKHYGITFRLDAQLRQLIAAKDTTLNQVLEQSRMMIESQRSMVDELRSFKDVVYNLSGQVDSLKSIKSSLDELKDIKRSVDDLKRSVDELQNFRNVSDMVYELKKEIQNMKKDSAKPQQSLQDDIYALDDDYSDYNLGNNLSFGANPYQNYPNRMQPPMPPASALYAHGYYPPMFVPPYGYPNIPLTQPGEEKLFNKTDKHFFFMTFILCYSNSSIGFWCRATIASRFQRNAQYDDSSAKYVPRTVNQSTNHTKHSQFNWCQCISTSNKPTSKRATIQRNQSANCCANLYLNCFDNLFANIESASCKCGYYLV